VWATLFVPDCRLSTNSMFTRRQYRLRSRKCPKVERPVLVTTRRFPQPWTVEELDACFVVRGQQLDRGLLPVKHSECKNARQALNRPCLHSILPKGLPRNETILFGGNGGFGVPEAARRGGLFIFWRSMHVGFCSGRVNSSGGLAKFHSA
jgi:hypothetical protein